MTEAEFGALLQRLAAAWHDGDPTAAAACFDSDAVYVEPPDRQQYRGRARLLEFFAGDGTAPMNMEWHHILFDEIRQLGAAEYTFQGHSRYHGIAVIRCRRDLISHWREYQYRSPLAWRQFVGLSEP